MGCFLESENGTQNAVLTFKREQLMYDIKNCAYIEGSVMETDSNHVRHTVQDVGEEGNVDRVTRMLDLSVAKCREELYPYTKHRIYRPGLDDRLKDQKVYGIILKVPLDFSQTTLNLLEQLVHEYLICEVMRDWLSITNPGKSAIWKEKAEDAMTEIKKNLSNCMGRGRRRLSPF